MISIAHKIEILPNNKQKTYFHKAFGCARLAYNWGLAEWQRMYEAWKNNPEEEKPSANIINKRFNAIKRTEFPFVTEVLKDAPQRAIQNDLKAAFKNFFSDLKKGKVHYPNFKKKRDGLDSFYISNDRANLSDFRPKASYLKGVSYNEKGKHQYLSVPRLGYVKMTQRLRFNGKLNGVTISRMGSRYFASFSMQITEEEYLRTHPHVKENQRKRNVGIDLGIKEALILSDGLFVENPKVLKQYQKKITRVSRQLAKRSHPKTKEERLAKKKCSANFKKLSLRLANLHRKVANVRKDFIQKTTTILTTQYAGIGMENLNVKGMTRNHRLAKSVLDVSFYSIKAHILYKATYNKVKVIQADKFYPSSKTCCVCGFVKKDLTLGTRTYKCPQCGSVMDRDLNASKNLLTLIDEENKIGTGGPKLTPVDLAALINRFAKNGISTSKVETGKQQKYNFKTLVSSSEPILCKE